VTLRHSQALSVLQSSSQAHDQLGSALACVHARAGAGAGELGLGGQEMLER